MHRAFSAMLTGRPGPVHIEVPMDVQAEAAEVELHALAHRLPVGRPYPDPEAIEDAARVLRAAERPVIVDRRRRDLRRGRGARSAPSPRRCERPVVTTWNGKSGFPEDHRLFAGASARPARPSATASPPSADVVHLGRLPVHRLVGVELSPGRLVLACRRRKLIQIDIDPHEIGKNYPAEVGIVADAKPALAALG